MYGRRPVASAAPMLARRLLAFAALLFAMAAIAAALVPQGGRRTPTGTTRNPAQTQDTSTSPSTVTGRTVHASLPGKGPRPLVLHVSVGDLIELDVAAKQPDTAELVGLGQVEATQPSTPAHFSFIPARAGSFDVRLQTANRIVGRLVISKRR